MILDTRTHKLFVARQEAAANSTFSDNLATQGDFANKPNGAVDVLDLIRLDPTVSDTKDPSIFADTKVNGIEFMFAGGDANDDEFTWKLYAWKNENGPARLAAEGTGILGSQAVVKWPHNGADVSGKFWADTLVVTAERWIKDVEATTAGGDSVSSVWIDCAGYRYFYIEIPTSVGKMSCYVGYW
jgi:hypothetical protein